MISDLLQNAIKEGRIEWQRHALEKMMERGISRKAVKDVLLNGEIIESYPDDKPYPSALFLGWVKNQPLHVVGSLDSTTGWCFIITAYKPDSEYFESDYKTRRVI
ncbi:MAG: DUF4258 domain-containing protein [Candidatus Scalindua sp.]|jgi:hypothetical protein|nr:DUF4258 domain-containing protein [Candidatus Scalindua sp.]MBT6053080.1 DUF4258 domain-containing protein [Candidatus Scalindua sp.]MBT6230437.1 DUF4258 domain-containing protein [Candidatus Scalindua sp.]MBT6563437.1 DUF4258 domain-containing protein [Candidatus Scalindua sp.]MBT7211602.1 DUF4258 domain-containing protein [Candidatus Scalindua sp.]